jgi:hypothetical protein
MKQYLASSSKAYRKAQAYLKDLQEVPGPFVIPGPGNLSAKLKKSSKRMPDTSDASNESESDDSSGDDENEWVNDLKHVEEDMERTHVRCFH